MLGSTLTDMYTLWDRVKAMRKALNDLSQPFERKVNTLKAELHPSFLHYGILSVPDETLEQIFNSVVHEPGDKPQTDPALVLSHVNSRFRRIALRRPSLWSCLSSRMTIDQLDSHVERAKAGPLSAVIVIGAPKEFADFLLEHTSRWESIKFVSQERSSSNDPGEELEELHLPNLTSFESLIKFDEEALTQWTMPKLKNLRLLETIPQSESSIFGSSTIERFVFSSTQKWFDTEPLTTFLLSLSNLVDLELDIEPCTEEDRVYCEEDSLGELPNLKHLRLKTSSPKIFSAILVQLNMPALETLDIVIHDEVEREFDPENYYPPSRWMLTLPLEPCPSVKRLRLTFQNTEHEELPLENVLVQFPELEHLELDIPVNQPSMFMFKSTYSSNKLLKMPPLQTVAMQVPPETFLEEFVQAMKQSDRWDKFERFRFKPTVQVTRTRAERLLTKQKVEWF